jgi:anti-sigma factor RsiW
MACERYEDALTETAAGAPPAPGLEAHLADCARCREELKELQRTLALVDSDLRQLVAVEPSPDLAVRIRGAAAEAPPERRPAWLWPALAAAAVLVLAVAIVMRREPSQAPPATAQNSPATLAATPEPPRNAPNDGSSAPVVPAAVATTSSVPRGDVRRGEPRRSLAAVEPEVIVPSGEAEALLRYAQSVRQRTLTTESLLVADLSAPLAEPRRVEIRPLEIVPLDPEEDSGAQ